MTSKPSLLFAAFVSAGLALAVAPSASASEAWPQIKLAAFQDRAIESGQGIIKLMAPYRPENVARVPIEADVTLPEGRSIKAISFIVDENPSPVAAAFKMFGERRQAHITTEIRLNQQSDVRVVVEADNGALYMAEQLVKFAGGQASCSAPPMGDPKEIAASMGRMTFAAIGAQARASKKLQRTNYQLSHPNHTGMVLDPVTLFYVPMLMVERIEAVQGDEPVFEMTGSITLSQNPRIEFDYVTNGATDMTMRATDTSGAVFERTFPIGPQS